MLKSPLFPAKPLLDLECTIVSLIDAPGAALFEHVADGDLVTVRGASVFKNGTCLATGRVLAADLMALRTQPPADVSAMDGYAVRAIDVVKVPVKLKL